MFPHQSEQGDYDEAMKIHVDSSVVHPLAVSILSTGLAIGTTPNQHTFDAALVLRSVATRRDACHPGLLSGDHDLGLR